MCTAIHLLRQSLFAAVLVAAAPLGTKAALLDFEGLGLAAFAAIPQSYGDAPWVDVTHQMRLGFGPLAAVGASQLQFWGAGYGDLINVAWSIENRTSNVAELRFDGLGGNAVQLTSFELAGWGEQSGRTVRVYDENWNVLAEYLNQTIPGVSHSTFTPNVTASSIIIQWDYPYGVAIDNVRFEQASAAVPEPAALLGWVGLGVVGLAGGLRRRRGCQPPVISAACPARLWPI